MDTSLAVRIEGNSLFTTADKLQPGQEKDDLYQKALDKYKVAFKLGKFANNHGDTLAACKNIASTNYRIARLQGTPQRDVKYYAEALNNFQRALSLSNLAQKSTQWITKLKKDFNKCVIDALNTAVKKKIRAATHSIEAYIAALSDAKHKYKCYVIMCGLLHKQSGEHLGRGECGPALGYLKECKTALEDAQQVLNDGGISLEDAMAALDDAQRLGLDASGDWTELNVSVKLQLIRAKAMQIIQQADTLFEEAKSSKVGGDLNMDVIYEVIDSYRKAINITEGKKLKETVVAYRHIAAVYSELKEETRAKEYNETASKLENETKDDMSNNLTGGGKRKHSEDAHAVTSQPDTSDPTESLKKKQKLAHNI